MVRCLLPPAPAGEEPQAGQRAKGHGVGTGPFKSSRAACLLRFTQNFFVAPANCGHNVESQSGQCRVANSGGYMGGSALAKSSTGMSTGEVTRLLNSARAGCHESANQLLHACRGYLRIVARQHLDRELSAKVDISDLVQETLVLAHGNLAEFRGSSERELLAWLRQVMKRLALATRRHYHTEQRNINRELSLDEVDLSEHGNDWLAAADETPRRRVVRREDERRMQQALAHLPKHYAEIIELRNHQLLGFNEIAERLSLSPGAARKRWCRALVRLQTELNSLQSQ